MKIRLILFIFIILNFGGQLHATDISFINYESELKLKQLENSFSSFMETNDSTINNPSFADYDNFEDLFYSQVDRVIFMCPYASDEDLHILFNSLKDIINQARSHEIFLSEGNNNYGFSYPQNQKTFFGKAKQYYGEGSPEFLTLIIQGVKNLGSSIVMDQLSAHNAENQYWKMLFFKFPYGMRNNDDIYQHSWEYLKAKSEEIDNDLIEVNRFFQDWDWKENSDYTGYLNVISDKIANNSYSKAARAELIKRFLDALEFYCRTWGGQKKESCNTGNNMRKPINAVIDNMLTIDGPQSADLLTMAKHLRWISWISSEPQPDIDKYCSRVFPNKDFVMLSKKLIDGQGSKLKFEDLIHLTTATLKSFDSMIENGVQWDYSLFSPTDLLKLNKNRIEDEYGEDSEEFLIFKKEVIKRYGEYSEEYDLILSE